MVASSALVSSTKKNHKSSSFAAEFLPDEKVEVAAEKGDNGEESNNGIHKKEEKTLSKRQRRKQVNNKHKWPQQPRIQSQEARAKAYLRVSGLTHEPKESIDAKEDLNSPSVRFFRLLGSPDQRTRHKAVLQLKAYLKARCDIEANSGLSELDLLKLWKGLWHTLYLADKVPVQEELSEQLASLIWCVAGSQEEDEYAGQAYMRLSGGDEDVVPYDYDEEHDGEDDMEEMEEQEDLAEMEGEEYNEDSGDSDEEDGNDDDDDDDDDDVVIQGVFEGDEESSEDSRDSEKIEDEGDSTSDSEIPHCRGAHLASLFVRTFLRTVQREWGNMDKYRIDKFYSLARKVMHQVYKYMSVRHWNLGIIRLFNDAIYEEALSQTPNGLRYHLIDLTLGELASVHAEAPMPLTEATFVDCLEPFFAMAQNGAGDDTVQARVVENILTQFLVKYSFIGELAEGDDEEAKKLVFDQVHIETIAKFIFDIASDPETKNAYRKSLYEVHKEFMRRLKKVGRDVELQVGMERLESEEADLEEEEENEDDIQYDGDRDTPEHPSRKRKVIEDKKEDTDEDHGAEKSKRSKKKKKRRSSEDSAEMDQSIIDEAIPAEEENSKKAKKKKKKRRTSEDSTESGCSTGAAGDNEDNGDALRDKLDTTKLQISSPESETNQVADSDLKEKKKKKRKKDKKKRSDDEQEIVISTKDQKKAKVAMTESKKSRPSKVATEDKSPETRRVQFASVNHARSWKVSMKSLRTCNPSTPPAKPDQSILLKKDRAAKLQKSANGKGKPRKRATDYF